MATSAVSTEAPHTVAKMSFWDNCEYKPDLNTSPMQTDWISSVHKHRFHLILEDFKNSSVLLAEESILSRSVSDPSSASPFMEIPHLTT